jgi:hypothetical protein
MFWLLSLIHAAATTFSKEPLNDAVSSFPKCCEKSVAAPALSGYTMRRWFSEVCG